MRKIIDFGGRELFGYSSRRLMNQSAKRGFFKVVRQDINGVKYPKTPVKDKIPTEEEAQRIADEFEARGHHQTYFVERDGHTKSTDLDVDIDSLSIKPD